ncbi:MAG: hypothetical protein R3C10_24025 [Pirellulales bacterium]
MPFRIVAQGVSRTPAMGRMTMVNVKKAMETTQPLAFDELIEAAEERIRQGLAPTRNLSGQVSSARRLDPVSPLGATAGS